MFHPGYNNALLAVYDSIIKPTVVDALSYFVGHSLGGLLATMAAIRTYHENLQKYKVCQKLCLWMPSWHWRRMEILWL